MSAKLINGMSNEKYHAHPAFSSSQLKDMARTPAHFYAKHMTKGNKKAPTDSMVLGTLVHTLLLEDDKFESEFAIAPKFDRRTKQGKADAQAFEEANAGKIIINDDMLAVATKMADKLKESNVAKLLGTQGALAESSIFYKDENTHIECRIRPDFHIPPCSQFPLGLIVDLKTTDDASSSAFMRTIVNFKYHLSAAMYQYGFMACYKTDDPPPFIWLVIERDAPYGVASYSPSASMLQRGREMLEDALQTLNICLENDEWPAYSPDILDINLPKWA